MAFSKFKVILPRRLEILLNLTFLRGNAPTMIEMAQTKDLLNEDWFHFREFLAIDFPPEFDKGSTLILSDSKIQTEAQLKQNWSCTDAS